MESESTWKLTWEAIGAIAAASAILGTTVSTMMTRLIPWMRAKVNSRSIKRRIGAEDFHTATLENALRYFVEPFCSQVDPSGREDFRSLLPFSTRFFKVFDNVLLKNVPPRYVILLADSGMGKTSALINYYVHNLRRWGKRTPITLLYLGNPDVIARISAVKDQRNTVLFLDALDEDVSAAQEPGRRIRELLAASSQFKAVVFSCRSQFFSSDQEITTKTGILRIGPRAAGESGEYALQKVYLLPFTNRQIRRYLRHRYAFWQLKKRRRALLVLRSVGDLSARPMLLSYMNDLIEEEPPVTNLINAYDRIIQAWIRREEGHVGNVEALRNFCERLAADLYLHRGTRGGEHAPSSEIVGLASEWGIDLDRRKLTGRSLLNRDGEGNYKFAHRSLMEFLFVRRCLMGEYDCLAAEWTDQMRRFLWEYLADPDGQAAFFKLIKAYRAQLFVHSGDDQAQPLMLQLIEENEEDALQAFWNHRAHDSDQTEAEIGRTLYLIHLLVFSEVDSNGSVGMTIWTDAPVGAILVHYELHSSGEKSEIRKFQTEVRKGQTVEIGGIALTLIERRNYRIRGESARLIGPPENENWRAYLPYLHHSTYFRFDFDDKPQEGALRMLQYLYTRFVLRDLSGEAPRNLFWSGNVGS